MDTTTKNALIAVLVALSALIAALIAWLTTAPVTPIPLPSPTTIPTPSPSVPPASVSLVIDGFERPEFAAQSDFRPAVTRMILSGASTGFVIQTKTPCTFNSVPAAAGIFKMVATDVKVPSYSTGRTGIFYDALVPLNAANCATAKYLWVDVAPTVTTRYDLGGASVHVVVKGTLPANPTKPIMMLMANSFLTAGHYGKYVNGSESLGVPYLKEMIAHRLHPYGSYVTAPPVSGGLLDYDAGGNNSFRLNSLNYNPSFVWLPNLTGTALTAANASVVTDGRQTWFYTMDEPQSGQLAGLRTTLASQKAAAPKIKRMVTTPFNSTLDVDIFAPVAEQFETGSYPKESAYAGHDLWLYVSCMSHGCSNDLAAGPAPHVPGNETGAPDLALDRSAAEPFGFMLLAQRYPSVKALLYYNTVEQYKLYSRGLDMWKGDLFNFGGNLDGTLFWPGRVGIEGLTAEVPVVSVRMKLLREAQNMADLMALAGTQSQAATIMTSPLNWKRSIKEFERVRAASFAVLQ